MPVTEGRHALEEAFRELVVFVNTLMAGGVPMSQVQHAPEFSYRLTPKQMAAIKKICTQEKWDEPECRGIEINVGTIAHILKSRLGQGVTPDFIGNILSAAYCEFSEVHLNKKRGEQAVFLNGIKKLKMGGSTWHAVAIIAIDGKDAEGAKKLASVTAYHADEAKIRGIKK